MHMLHLASWVILAMWVAIAQGKSSRASCTTCLRGLSRVDKLNMNLTVIWDPPPETDNITVTYNVRHRKQIDQRGGKKSWKDAIKCTNITARVCVLSPDSLDTASLAIHQQVKIFAILPSGEEIKYYYNNFCPTMDATVSAPEIVIDQVNISARHLRVPMRTHLTPYTDKTTGKQLRMAELPLEYPGIAYNFTLETIKGEKFVFPIDIKERIFKRYDDTILTIDNTYIKPVTDYILRVQSVYQSRPSRDTTVLYITTPQAAPIKSPSKPSIFNTTVDCSKPDVRDVLINWKAPVESWNVNLTHFEIHYRLNNSISLELSPVSVESTGIDSIYEATLYNLSRWDSYEMWVSAHNTGGSSSSHHTFIPETFAVEDNCLVNVLPSWAVGLSIGGPLFVVMIVVLIISRNCVYRIISDDTLENNKILEKARKGTASLPYCQQNSEGFDEVSRYIPVQNVANAPEEPTLNNSWSTCSTNLAISQATGLDESDTSTPRLPSAADMSEVFDQPCVRDDQSWSLLHLYSNANRPNSRKTSEADTVPSEPTSPIGLPTGRLWSDSIKEDISSYCDMSDTKKKINSNDAVTMVSGINVTVTPDSEQSVSLKKKHVTTHEEQAKAFLCGFPDKSYINVKKARAADYLNNNTLPLISPRPPATWNSTTSEDFELDENTRALEVTDDLLKTLNISDIPITPASNVANNGVNIDAYTTIDQLGLPMVGINRGKKSQTKQISSAYVSNQPFLNTELLLTDKDMARDGLKLQNAIGLSSEYSAKDLILDNISTEYLPHHVFHHPHKCVPEAIGLAVISSGPSPTGYRPCDLLDTPPTVGNYADDFILVGSSDYCPLDIFSKVPSTNQEHGPKTSSITNISPYLTKYKRETNGSQTKTDPYDTSESVTGKAAPSNMEYTKLADLPFLCHQ